jgi:hypothetical protein
MIYLSFLSVRLSRSHDPSHEVSGLTEFTLVIFLVLFKIDFFLISSFKVELI